jgi:hypothetical protein
MKKMMNMATMKTNDVWLFNHTEKFPKSPRFSMAVRIENQFHEADQYNRNHNNGFRVCVVGESCSNHTGEFSRPMLNV